MYRWLALFFVIAMTSTPVAQAQMENSSDPQAKPSGFGIPFDPLYPDGLELAALFAYYDYEEPGLMEETGFLPGLGLRYTYREPGVTNLSLVLDFDALFGDLEYDGGTWGGDPLSADTSTLILDFRALLGYDLSGDSKWRVTPFAGLAFRRLSDDIDYDFGYRRRISYLYSPVGLDTGYKLSSRTAVGLSAEYDIFWQGWVNSLFSDIDPDWEDAANQQSIFSGHGVRVTGHFTYLMPNGFVLRAEPFFRYWWVGDSETDTVEFDRTLVTVLEPENSTKIYGLRLSIGF